ncbi:ABC transporter ATP-binding protein/permease [Thermodesulfobacteriota bacterium]
MKDIQTPVVKRSLFSWVRSSSIKLQVVLLFVITITVLTRVLPLEMQKRIVNEAINLRKVDLLFLYCGIYLAAVIVASGLKFLMNFLQTTIAQRALADMRMALYHHILTLPLNFFRRTQAGMVVSALVTEIASAGDFVGMAIAVPITSLLTLLAFGGYLFWLNPILAVISLSIYPVALLLIPFLQKRANRANKRRVDSTRDISNLIGESITGVHEIQANGAFRMENRKFDRITERLRKIRIVWNLYRFGVKITNNFFTNLSPFLIFVVGGLLAMKGQLGLGSLVAFLSAQEKLYEPWRELIDFYQAYQDASVRYKRTMDYFDTISEYSLEPEGRAPYELDGSIQVKDLSFVTESGIRLIDDISFSLSPGEHLALVGFSGSGKSTLAQCIGQLYKYSGGHAYLGNQEISELSKKDMIYNIGYVSQAPFIFTGTIEDNLLYSWLAKSNGGGDGEEGRLPSLDDIISILQQTGIFVDVLSFGLNTVLDRNQEKALVPVIVRIRENFQHEYGKALSDYVEFFDENRYLYHSSVAGNLIFGTSHKASFDTDNLSKNPYFLKFLNKADLTRPLLSLGFDLCKQTIDILGNLPPDEMFFEQSPIASHEVDEYKIFVARVKKMKLHQFSEKDREKLLDIVLRFTPGKHKMVPLPGMLEKLILEGRALFKDEIARDDPDAFSFYQMTDYIDSQSILNNILFGKPKSYNPIAQEKINQSIIQLLIEEDLLEKITGIGMQFQVGSKGDRLSGGQRQKLAIARALIKSPKVLIMDEATSALDNKSQSRIQNLLDTRWKGKSTLISVVHRLDIIKTFDRVAVMKAGKLGEIGTYDELMERKGMLYELVGRK